MVGTIKFELAGALKFVTDDEPSKAGAFFTVHYESFTIKARGNDMVYKLPSDKTVKMRVDYVDAKGNPASVETVTWDSSNESIITVELDASDDQLVRVVPGAQLGQAQISATADVDLGAGVKPLITTGDIEVVGGEAVAGTITPVGEPE